jgi:hypothetical protein
MIVIGPGEVQKVRAETRQKRPLQPRPKGDLLILARLSGFRQCA